MPRVQRVYCCAVTRRPLLVAGLPLSDAFRLLSALHDGRDPDWARVGAAARLPPPVCRAAWHRLCAAHARSASGEAETAGETVETAEKRLLQAATGRLKERGCLDVVPPAEPAEVVATPVDGQAKRRFTAEEDRLLLKALFLHQGSFEAVQSRYFPTQPLTYVKSRYTATLKKHAMAHYGLKNAAELRNATSQMPHPRAVAELLLLYPWLGSEQFTEADLAAEAARLVEALR